MRSLAPLAAVALLAVGCGHARHATRFGGLVVVETVRSTWHATRPPHGDGPAREVANVGFFDAQTGIALSSSPGIPYRSAGTGRVQRTDDGGRTWQTVWSGRDAALHALALVGRRGALVLGTVVPRRGSPEPFVLRSADAGLSWQRVRARLPRSAETRWPAFVVRFPTLRVGFAVPDSEENGPVDVRWLLRTTDGGRTWRELPRPRGIEGPAWAVDFVTPRLGFATAGAPRCGGVVVRTEDGGLTWRVLRSSCAKDYGLTAIDFRDARHGVVAGGHPYYFEAPPWQVIRITSDAGRRWQTVYVDRRRRNPGTNPVARLVEVDARHLWAATGGCKGGQNGPCGGDVLVSGDAGRTWRRTGRDATQLAAVDARSAWVVPVCEGDCGVLWRTEDAGRSWTPYARPTGAGIRTVASVGRTLLLTSAAGSFRSRDGGRTWRRLRWDLPRLSQDEGGTVRPGLVVTTSGTRTIEISRDDGRTFVRVRSPVAEPGALAFADARRGFVAPFAYEAGGVWATRDGGRTWRRLRAPFTPDAISAAPGLVVLSAFQPARVALSGDAGRTWRDLRLPRRRQPLCNATAGGDGTAWLGCVYVDGDGGTRPVAFRSGDAGRTWTRIETPRWAQGIVSQDGEQAWTVAGFQTASLWHSRDAGRTWRQLWPRLPTPG